MKIEARANIKNRFDIKIEHTDTGKVEWLKAENIVLNACFTRLVNFNTYFSHIHFGTGTGTLSAARTSLFTFLSQKAASTVQSVRAHPTSRWVRSIVINPEEHVGAVLTEVGIAYGTSSSNLCTHAFIEDSEGNPINLVKTDTMVVTIIATVYFQLGAIDSMYGGKWRFVQPLANNELLSYLMGASYPTQQFRVTRAPEFSNGTAPASHGSSPNILVADWVKDAANKKVTTPVRRLGVSVGNGEVRGFGLGSSDTLGTFRGQFPITGVFTSKAITGESLGAGDGSKVGFNLAWNDPASLVVKIDGILTTDYASQNSKRGRNYIWREPLSLLYHSSFEPTDTHLLTDDNLSTQSALSGTIHLGADVGSLFAGEKAAALRVRSGNTFHQGTVTLRGSDNPDFSDSVFLATLSISTASAWLESLFSPVAYRYYKIETVAAASYMQIAQIQITAADQIQFHTPPALNAVITADYTVDYVPKDSNHVLDLQATIQYGEIT